MKLHIYSSNFNPLYSDIQEIPDIYCVKEGDVITVSKTKYCPKPCDFERPFGKKPYEPVCCDNCKE